jgi:alanine racemase
MNRRTFLTSTGAAALALPALSHLSEAAPQSLSPPDISKSFEPWLDIKLDAFTWNVEQLSARAGNRPVMAVLKDNAYGHGLVGVASHLDTLPQVNSFAVVKIQEAIDIKNSSARKPVVLLGPTTDEELEYVVAHDIIPSVYHDRSRFMQSLSVKYQKKIKTHLYVDTGMGRVGVPYYQAMPVIEALAGQNGIVFDGVLTELMEIDEYDIEQVQHLNEVYEQARSKGINLGMRHAASSGGIFHVPEAYLDMVRPGISLYGCYPTDRSTKTRDIPLKSTFDFKTRVMYVKQLRAGDSLQYGRHYVAEKPIWIATLPVGHSDGWPRTTVGNCEVLIKGRRYPLVASLSANHCLVEIGDEPTVSMGDEVLLVGESGGETIEAHTVAEQSGVGVYTLTMHLNPWLPRRYVG